MSEPLIELRAYLAHRRGFAGDAEFGDMAAATRDYVKFSRWLGALDGLIEPTDAALGRCQVLLQCHRETGHEGGHEAREENTDGA